VILAALTFARLNVPLVNDVWLITTFSMPLTRASAFAAMSAEVASVSVSLSVVLLSTITSAAPKVVPVAATTPEILSLADVPTIVSPAAAVVSILVYLFPKVLNVNDFQTLPPTFKSLTYTKPFSHFCCQVAPSPTPFFFFLKSIT